MHRLSMFKWSAAGTLLAVSMAGLYGGLGGIAVVAALIALEASVSFDNAVVNATVLRKLAPRWQRAFLTVGILFAVFVMRVLFPLVVVRVATGADVLAVAGQALHDRRAYAASVREALPTIGAFGGVFLLLVSLDFFFKPEKRLHWLGPLERTLSRAGRVKHASVALVTLSLLVLASLTPSPAREAMLIAGLSGMVTYLTVHGVADALLPSKGEQARGRAGLMGFVYLELLDASFSLDGVLGAFAISTDIVLIALGLSAGALFVRSLTVYLVRHNAMCHYVYIAHGAHWAIGTLGIVLLVSTHSQIPEWATAVLGVSFIAASLASSIVHNRRTAQAERRAGTPLPRAEQAHRVDDMHFTERI